MSQTPNDKIYFGGLNGLRFFAATAVIFHHIEQYKLWASANTAAYASVFTGHGMLSTIIQALGHKAVSFFFVLSGFLITYLLLAETTKTGTVALKKFYIRRILRIWPVYYLVIAVAFFVVPHFFDIGGNGQHLLQNHFWIWFALSFLMLPNLVRYNSVEIVGGSQTWSVGVEEQFYLIWPWLVRKFRKHFVRMLLMLIIGKLLVSVSFGLLVMQLPAGKVQLICNKFLLYWNLFKIEQMAVGALGAFYLYHQKPRALKFFYSPVTNWLNFFLFVSLFIVEYKFYGDTLFEALIFLLVIINVSTNPACPVKLRHPVFNALGNYSYGIYMYHTIVIAILFKLTSDSALLQHPAMFNGVMYLGAPLLTIFVSWLSYSYYEQWFLRLKERFMVVKSGSSGGAGEEIKTPQAENVTSGVPYITEK
ncbi:MAG: acyltransferase [Bacteroidia bacterium]